MKKKMKYEACKREAGVFLAWFNVCMLKSAKKAARSRVFYSLKTSSTTLNVKRWLVFVCKYGFRVFSITHSFLLVPIWTGFALLVNQTGVNIVLRSRDLDHGSVFTKSSLLWLSFRYSETIGSTNDYSYVWSNLPNWHSFYCELISGKYCLYIYHFILALQ